MVSRGVADKTGLSVWASLVDADRVAKRGVLRLCALHAAHAVLQFGDVAGLAQPSFTAALLVSCVGIGNKVENFCDQEHDGPPFGEVAPLMWQ